MIPEVGTTLANFPYQNLLVLYLFCQDQQVAGLTNVQQAYKMYINDKGSLLNDNYYFNVLSRQFSPESSGSLQNIPPSEPPSVYDRTFSCRLDQCSLGQPLKITKLAQ